MHTQRVPLWWLFQQPRMFMSSHPHGSPDRPGMDESSCRRGRDEAGLIVPQRKLRLNAAMDCVAVLPAATVAAIQHGIVCPSALNCFSHSSMPWVALVGEDSSACSKCSSKSTGTPQGASLSSR
jgi:hypothetical protein